MSFCESAFPVSTSCHGPRVPLLKYLVNPFSFITLTSTKQNNPYLLLVTCPLPIVDRPYPPIITLVPIPNDQCGNQLFFFWVWKDGNRNLYQAIINHFFFFLMHKTNCINSCKYYFFYFNIRTFFFFYILIFKNVLHQII